MNDSKDFQDAESIRSGNSHVTSRPVSFPPHPIPEGTLRHSFVTPSRREGPPSIWDTHGISGNAFANPDASSSESYPQELRQWNSSIEEPLHSSTVEKSERQEQNQDLRCQKSLTPRIRRNNCRAHPSRSAKTHTTRTKFSPKITCPALELTNITYRMAILAFNFKFLVVARIRMELEVSSYFFLLESLSFFVTVGFVYS